MQRSPENATHFVISSGGNNALMHTDILNMRANSAAEVFNVLADRTRDFENNYRKMLETVLKRNIPTAVCTIYNPNFPETAVQKVAVAALCAFNDVIIRQAILAGVPFLDLRLICNEKDDYANPIEPSSKGGQKIAAKILEVVENHDFAARKTCVYF
jgi:lysophospholipase L1-like esterase